MRFHCNKCGRDFTTLAERDKAIKFNLTHFILDKMFCPHCGARNHAKVLKPLKVIKGARYQPKRRSMDTDDYSPPSVVVFSECQKRLTGSPYSPEGMSVICEGCRFAFGCLTGNVDDGILETDDPDFVAKRKEEAVVKAKEMVAKKERDDELTNLQMLRKQLGKINFGYEFRKSMWYCRFGGTCWKLNEDDLNAILALTWSTPNTTIIKRTLDKKEVKQVLPKMLLNCELQVKNRGA